jgi:hypothetical protein
MNPPGQGIRHRLTGMAVQEVSVVDDPANKRRFLFYKSKEQMMPTAPGAELAPNPNGPGHVKKDAQQQPAAATLTLSAMTKAALTAKILEAQELLKAQLAVVQGAAETATTNDIPASVAEPLAKASLGIAGLVPEHVEKAGWKQFTPERMAQLQTAAGALAGILSNVAPPPVAAPAAAAAPASAVDVTEQVTKATKGAVAPLENNFQQLQATMTGFFEEIAKSVEGISDAVNGQAGRLEKLEKARGGSNAGDEPRGEPAPTRVPRKKSSEAWGTSTTDLSAQRVAQQKQDAAKT